MTHSLAHECGTNQVMLSPPRLRGPTPPLMSNSRITRDNRRPLSRATVIVEPGGKVRKPLRHYLRGASDWCLRLASFGAERSQQADHIPPRVCPLIANEPTLRNRGVESREPIFVSHLLPFWPQRGQASKQINPTPRTPSCNQKSESPQDFHPGALWPPARERQPARAPQP